MALLANAASGFALWRTFDEPAPVKQPVVVASSTTTTLPRLVVVPSLYGKHIDVVRPMLEKLGLKVSTVPAPSSTVPPNRVISQDPQAGQRVDRGSAIILRVSSGSV